MKKKIFDYYVNAIAKEFNISKTQMFKNSKKRDYVDARQMLYYACMERPMRLSYIKSYLKEYGYEVQHSTIIHGYKQAKILIDTDPDYKEMIEGVIQDYNKQFTQELSKRREGNRFFQMVDKVPYNNSKKGQAFILKSSEQIKKTKKFSDKNKEENGQGELNF